MRSIVILASGRGSNARRIIEHFSSSDSIRVIGIVSDRKESGALSIALEAGLDAHYVPKSEVASGGLTKLLLELNPDMIVLAGFLLMIPSDLIAHYPEKIINVHPSILPNHGGPGMYGAHVHTSVIKAKDKESGITIHYVDEIYDHGRKIASFYCPVLENDTPETLASRVLQLEHQYFPLIIEKQLSL